MLRLLKLNDVLARQPKAMREAVAGTLRSCGLQADAISIKRSVAARDVESLEPGSRTAIQMVSTRHIDRDGDVVLPAGMLFDEFKKSNMQVFWNHDYGELIGSDDWVKRTPDGIQALTRYADTGEGTRANIVFALKQQGHLKTNSIGFAILSAVNSSQREFDKALAGIMRKWPDMETDRDNIGRIIDKAMMIEHSDVGVPANVNATLITAAKGLGADNACIKSMFGVDVSGVPMGDPAAFAAAAEAEAAQVRATGLKTWADVFVGTAPITKQATASGSHVAIVALASDHTELRLKADHFGPGISAVFGIKASPRAVELQAVWFSAAHMGGAPAQSWLAAKGIKALTFAPAAAPKAPAMKAVATLTTPENTLHLHAPALREVKTGPGHAARAALIAQRVRDELDMGRGMV